MVLALVFIVLVAAFGSLLPLYMFYNTMQLVVHLPLFNNKMPARVVNVLRHYLDIWRFNWGWIRNGLIEGHYLERYELAKMDPYLVACDF